MSPGRTAFLMLVLTASPALAQAPGGPAVFERACATCHTSSPADGRTPAVSALRALTPEGILAALTTGTMRAQGADLSDAERRAVASYLAGPGAPAAPAPSAPAPLICPTIPPVTDPAAGPSWIGWGNGFDNRRFQPANEAGLTAAQVPRLTLKWAFGFPAARSGRSQPTFGGGRVLVAGEGGEVYSLDPRTGCQHWMFRAQASVRTSITIGTYAGEGAEGPYAVYFGDTAANVYAVDLITGLPLWTRRVDEHPLAGVTGSPVFHLGRLYVPVAGLGEEIQAGSAQYECCTFRGSVAALDANTGEAIWKTYTTDPPARRGESAAGTPRWGPSGGGVWSAPTLDLARRVLYVGTGNGYSDPPQPYTNAVLALDMRTGEIRWAFQATQGDVWNLACMSNGGNCPPDSGPDFDFGSSPMLVTRPGGRDLIIAGQKSGMAYALDPDADGELVWEYRAGRGSMAGGIQWGPATDGERAYFAVSDSAVGPAEAGGLHAVDVTTGQRAWSVGPQPPACGALGPQCHGAQSAAVSVMPGIVFSGSSDGAMRAFDSATGEVLWTYDTNRAFPTVNGVPATGGSIDGPGPVVAGGMLFFNSGYAFGRPGNVLLAFSAD